MKLHATTRGAMISTLVKAEDLRVLAGWGANHVRWQLTWGGYLVSPADDGDAAAYEAWLEGVLEHVDSLLPLCRELGLAVLVDLHTPPGGRNREQECRLFTEKRLQDVFLAAWERMALRYKGEKTIWGYDLFNEPVEGEMPAGVMDWRDLAIETTRRIRAIDPDHAIIIQGAPWGGPSALAEFEPLPFDKIVYSFHMYEPDAFTHQGVIRTTRGLDYPGQYRGIRWDKAQMRRVLQPVADWQRVYNKQIYVGEFAAIRWAPGESARDYLRDCIELFEENGWGWAYHAFREWDGWSVEHVGDREHTQLAPQPTSRQNLLLEWFAKNQRPNESTAASG